MKFTVYFPRLSLKKQTRGDTRGYRGAAYATWSGNLPISLSNGTSVYRGSSHGFRMVATVHPSVTYVKVKE